ncbi:rho-related GTP-binding protein RhoN-like [Branchiostoma floridae]|uniref:Rho-related GTP-binding protein RhoN-like n=2 Tax=Branchiostoma TaxID=7737 RepID=C3YW53_BRAFL|nr:rho-related GTP-binding protein RhoN-like [Branchiostoma floridae]CAH1238786.1 RND3 [Branchiostoma lanceolatum]|eukprot:XP_002599495.1 hypothetical protein BRAFLDRAFT_223842 [Branchiostoma floridae]
MEGGGGSSSGGNVCRCKLIVVGDERAGKTALLQVFAKDKFLEEYVPTVFENYKAGFEVEKQRVELSLWDTSGQTAYDNVRPLSYPDSNVILACFDIGTPESLDGVVKKWHPEVREYCPSAPILLVGCKADLRQDLKTVTDLAIVGRSPVSHEQGMTVAKQIGAVAYVECSAKTSELSIRDVFEMATLAALGKLTKALRQRTPKRHVSMKMRQSRSDSRMRDLREFRGDRTKSCVVM